MKYCVYLTIYKGSKLPRRYIGSSSVQRVLSGYNGSIKSKVYKETYREEQRVNKHLFKTRILSFHESQIDAVEQELKIQLTHKVIRSPGYMNRAYATPNGFFGRDTHGEKHPMFGKHHSVETREHLSKVGREAFALGLRTSPFATIDFSGEKNGFYGKLHSEDTKALMRKPKRFVPKWKCPHCSKDFDAGNFDQHLGRNLKWSKVETAAYRSEHQPNNIKES